PNPDTGPERVVVCVPGARPPRPGPVSGPAADRTAPDPAGNPALAGAAQGPDTALTAVSTTAGVGALLALALCGAAALRRRSRTGRSPAADA
ncbi:hypothetical protein AB0F33_34270, partial [Streptomyces parvus]